MRFIVSELPDFILPPFLKAWSAFYKKNENLFDLWIVIMQRTIESINSCFLYVSTIYYKLAITFITHITFVF